jgi:hypothetical protein
MKGPWKAYAFLVAVVATVLVLSTSALAVGGHRRSASVAAAPQWVTSVGPAAWSGRLTALYPGAANDTEFRTITVVNNGANAARLLSVTASIPAAPGGDARSVAGADIRGCRASWFTAWIAHANRALPAQLAPGKVFTGQLDLVMRDTSTDQDACRHTSPAVTVTAR